MYKRLLIHSLASCCQQKIDKPFRLVVIFNYILTLKMCIKKLN
jgi:hypothetical protein